MSKTKHGLLCVAHPDDESIFFAGLLLQKKSVNWTVVCVTDGNADGQGQKRHRQFLRACRLLGVKRCLHWKFPDKYECRLPVEKLIHELSALPEPAQVYTHGILGEYEHPHHQDVSFAVHSAFSNRVPVWSVAYNSYPEVRINLSATQFTVKSKILTEIYGSETQRFLNLLPATSSEGFTRVSLKEVTALYDFFAHAKPLRGAALEKYRWLKGYLRERGPVQRQRPF